MAALVAAAIVLVGVVVGGRRGLALAGLLALLAGYWAWWFGWGLDASINPFSAETALLGIADGAAYELGLLANLWPLVSIAAVIVAALASRRGARVPSALGVLSLVLVLASLPVRGTWSDTCNDTTGAAPLLTLPATQGLMDAGIGVLPSGSSTLVGCEDTANRRWKPFWLGDDHLPPEPGLYGRRIGEAIRFPQHPRRDPSPLPGRRLDHVIVLSWPGRDELNVLVETRQPLGRDRAPAYPQYDFRIAGRRADDDNAADLRGAHGWCYAPVWVGVRGLPPHRAGDRIRVDLVSRGRRLASGAARVRVLGPDEDRSNEIVRRMGRSVGCPPLW